MSDVKEGARRARGRRASAHAGLLLAALMGLAGCDDGAEPAGDMALDLAPRTDGGGLDQGVDMTAPGDLGPESDRGPVADQGPAADQGQTGDQGPAADQGADDMALPTPALRAPQVVAVGDDPVELFVQFAAVQVTTTQGPQRIWTRSYGLQEGVGQIPGPTFEFRPGDLLQVTLNNLLSAQRLQALIDFEMLEAENAGNGSDELIHVAGEINVPHNADNTNLHTHGLHVDPSHDDVTLIITPEGDSAANYAPALQPVIREQIWPYQYRIPATHLPGTHWYHAHKHGSTSTHVENGMAGALVIRPQDDADALVPGLDRAHDRVMHLQLIDNFGVQQGSTMGGGGGGGPTGLGTGYVAVNGDHQPTLALQPGQVERWRLINAAANHRSLSYVWLGRATGQTQGMRRVVEQVPMHLVAIDGITLKAPIEVTADRPIFLGPGNRADVVVALPEGDYTLFKNYPNDVAVVDAAGQPAAVRPSVGPNANPYLFALTDGLPGFAGLQVAWATADAMGNPGAPDDCLVRNRMGQVTGNVPAPCTPVVPLLRVAPITTAEGHTLAEITHDLRFPDGRWQPIPRQEIGGGGGGQADAQVLLTATVAGAPADGPAFDRAALAAQMGRLSPTGAARAQVPAYVSPVPDDAILQSRSVTFDISGISAQVQVQGDGQADPVMVRQFTLNGRQFALEDSIGDPRGQARIAEAPSEPDGVLLDYLDRASRWLNRFWTNPGYYAAVVQTDAVQDPTVADAPVYRYGPTEDEPGIEAISGLAQEALVNPASRFAPAANTPGLPVATSAEEWVLINNSAVAHPFHIHIN
ncbi:MAG: multicopper oxidase domain-containing protein, partial [Myxococcales bacterium]|nr:multicopper oxidase domain-containing protein [Myxococcales bacterium]